MKIISYFDANVLIFVEFLNFDFCSNTIVANTAILNTGTRNPLNCQ